MNYGLLLAACDFPAAARVGWQAPGGGRSVATWLRGTPARLRDDTQNLLSIQYWQYGGSFILAFGRRPRGPLATAWGSIIPEQKLEVAYLPVQDRARLQARDAPPEDTFAGFRFACFGADRDSYEPLALRVASCLPQVEAWLSQREVGPDVVTFAGV